MDPPGWERVGKGVDSPKNHMAQEGALGGSGLTPSTKPQRVHYKLEEAIEKPYSDILAHTPEVCKVFRRINGCLATKDNHDSWGMCTTSTECRTIMTVVLMVMSGMDPHTIRVTWFWYGWDVGMVGQLFFRSDCHCGLCGRFDVAF
jgi:hypothetical protein